MAKICFFCNGATNSTRIYSDPRMNSPIELNSCFSCDSLDEQLLLSYIKMKLWTTSYLGRYNIHQYAKAMRK